MQKRLSPFGDRLLCRATDLEEQNKNGIFIPSAKNVELERGCAQVLTTCCREIPNGAYVYFRKYCIEEITVDDVRYFIVDKSDVLAVLETNGDETSTVV